MSKLIEANQPPKSPLISSSALLTNNQIVLTQNNSTSQNRMPSINIIDRSVGNNPDNQKQAQQIRGQLFNLENNEIKKKGNNEEVKVQDKKQSDSSVLRQVTFDIQQLPGVESKVDNLQESEEIKNQILEKYGKNGLVIP